MEPNPTHNAPDEPCGTNYEQNCAYNTHKVQPNIWPSDHIIGKFSWNNDRRRLHISMLKYTNRSEVYDSKHIAQDDARFIFKVPAMMRRTTSHLNYAKYEMVCSTLRML